jgi:hypothetical protein
MPKYSSTSESFLKYLELLGTPWGVILKCFSKLSDEHPTSDEENGSIGNN